LENLASALAGVVGGDQVFAEAEIGDRYRIDFTRKYASRPAFLVRPATAEEVAGVVKVAAERGVPVTVVGGQTSTVGGAVPADGGIALSLERMNRIMEIDPVSMTMTVDAGCLLQNVQDAAEGAGMLLPLDLGSRGSATIGGVIGTNAGGNRVLRWGMTRDMVIGLEAVLADGSIVSSLTKMLKDNAGYNWKHLLIGSEGTLGVVVRAVLRLRPLPTSRQTALLAINTFEECALILRRLEQAMSGRLSSFELMWEEFYTRMTEGQLPDRPRPLPLGHAYYALVEAMGCDRESDEAQFERALEELLGEGLVQNAVIAQSDREREALWAVREDMMRGIETMRPLAGYDISMSLSDMPAFVEMARSNITAVYPHAKITFYGHAGDGNLHALVGVGAIDAQIVHQLDTCVFDAVRAVNGSISAEHGIGTSRAPFMSWSRTPEELRLMQLLKNALDPGNILNRGKMLDAWAAAGKPG
jgi:FAD/FMN-containing dehydrogenase